MLTEPRVIKFRPGQRREHWKKNCVAVGLASGFIEPLESTSIHLIQRSMIRLMQMFPRAGIQQSDIDEFNQQMSSEIEHIRDFIVLHYHVTESPGHAVLARRAATWSIPASLQHRIDLFRETGRVFRVPNELFAENSWIQVMLGQGIMPRQHHPVADLMGDEELSRFLEGIESSVDKHGDAAAEAPGLSRAVLQSAGRAPRSRRVKRASANMYEVAKLADVSIATVSRVSQHRRARQGENAAESAVGDAQARLPAEFDRAVARDPHVQQRRRAGLGAARRLLRRDAERDRGDAARRRQVRTGRDRSRAGRTRSAKASASSSAATATR